MKLIERIQRKGMTSIIGKIDSLEESIVAMPESHRSVADSPVRFEIMKEGMKRGRRPPRPEVARIVPATIRGVRRSMSTVIKNPKAPHTKISDEFLSTLESYAKSQGLSSIGYTRVPERWIFKNRAILYLNAIMLTMEMDKARIATAPSIAGMQTVFETYRDLGIAANNIAAFLRKHGCAAQAAHPLMGPALYPPLTQAAGLGWLSYSGLIITPEHGPRVRLAAVFTGIENLPFSHNSSHRWIEDFCDKCGLCIRKCPVGAIYQNPEVSDNGQITCVSNPLCFPYFSDYYGCSVCMKVCPFNNVDYDKIKRVFEKTRSTRDFVEE